MADEMPTNGTELALLNGGQAAANTVLRVWFLICIIFVGVITNSLVLATLCRSKAGWKPLKIILVFLAAADLLVMLLTFFLEYIPMYHAWFVIYYENTCGVATTVLLTSLTAATWYLVLLTLERLAIVYSPSQVKSVFTAKKTIAICCCIPLFCFCIYAYFLTNMEPLVTGEYIVMCVPKMKQSKNVFMLMNQLWVTFSFFLPVLDIALVNCSIFLLLKVESLRESSPTVPTTENMEATKMVAIVSMVSVALMLPRGIFICTTLKDNWTYSTAHHFLFDAASLDLQLLSHAINLFVYASSNSPFRHDLASLCCCKSRSPRQTSSPETEAFMEERSRANERPETTSNL